jgi:azurin
VTPFTSRGYTLVIKHTGSKTNGVMTNPAIFAGRNMRGQFTWGHRAVMAACAITGNVAVLCGRHMDHRRILASSEHTVMTPFAAPVNTLMIKYRWDKCITRDVTNTAIVLCRDMRISLTGGYDTVMAGRAVIENIYMVECRPNKRCGIEMTDRAIFGSRQVIIGKPNSNDTVVARGAIARYAVMIKYASRENPRRMAHTAVVGGRHMVKRLTCSVNPVMAGSTQFIDDARYGMVKTFRPGEGAGVMAHAAIGGYRGVIRRFTRGSSAVVASLTSRGNGAVVEDNNQKIIHHMALIAGTISGYMSLRFTPGHDSIMTGFTISGNSGVVITAVCLQLHKSGCIVTVITFDTGWWMLVGLANGHHTVVALTALAKHF